MIDPDLINQNAMAREGFKLVAMSGILEAQELRLKERLAAGDADEADDSMLKSIREFRRQYGMIATLRSLGEGNREGTEQ